jgi:hypothetical protein
LTRGDRAGGEASPGMIRRVARCELRVTPKVWPFSATHAAAIDAHWRDASATRPHYFNGRIFVMAGLSINADVLRADLIATDFKSLLLWRSLGFPETGVCDGFGSALIQSADGDYLLVRQAAGHLNEGLAYLPGGFIDGRDVGQAGYVDIAASVDREVAEETGLGATDVQRSGAPFIVTTAGPHVSIAVSYRSSLTSRALVDKVRGHILSGADPEQELAEVVAVGRACDLATLNLARYAAVLMPWLVGGWDHD